MKNVSESLLLIVSNLAAIVVVALVVHYALPLLSGVHLQNSILHAFCLAAVYQAFELAMLFGFKSLPEIGLERRPGKGSNAEPLKFSSRQLTLPYGVLLGMVISLRIFIGVVFVAILSAYLPQVFHGDSAPLILISGAAISLASWMSPIALLFVIVLGDIIVLIPAWLLLWIVGRGKTDKNVSKRQKDLAAGLGYLMGAGLGMLFLPIMILLKTVPQYAPPYVVPEGLTAKKYYELGVKYKGVGWTEQARTALKRAIAFDPDGEFAPKAKRYMNTKLPRNVVPTQAVERNIQGFNYMASGNYDLAKKTFEDLIAEFPQFEWPYSNLAALYINDKNAVKARELAEKAVAINPDYVNAWMRLADIAELENDLEGAKAYVEKAFALDPDDGLVKLKKAVTMQEPGTPP